MKEKQMKRFVYKVRDDGLAILDLQTIDDRIKMAAKFLANFKSIMTVSRKGIGQKPVVKFTEAISGKVVVGRFLPGTITNPSFRGYYEPDVLLITDPLADVQAVKEALNMRIPIVALCDTFNETNMIDFIIPVNNKGKKSLAMVYYALAVEILKIRGVKEEDIKFKPEDFESEEMKEDYKTERRERRPAQRRQRR